MSARREVRIALWARLYRVLADHPAYLRDDARERIERTDPDVATCLGEVEAELIASAGEIDRFCGYAVAVLRRGAGQTGGLIDALGILEDDRLAAVALALPEPRRRAIAARDGTWSVALRGLDAERLREADAIANSLNDLRRRIDDGIRTTLGYEIADDCLRIVGGSRRLNAGLAHDLSLDDRVTLAAGHHEARELLAVARREHLEVVA